MNKTLILTASVALIALTACDKIKTEAKYPTSNNREYSQDGNDIYSENKGIFGGGGLLGSNKDKNSNSVGISVNSFLWRASLDTISFMPITSADPFGGTILTDWYTAEGSENERLKVNVFILTRELRSDGLRVRVFKQIRKKNGWVDVDAAPETSRQLEDAILTRARQIRITQLNQ